MGKPLRVGRYLLFGEIAAGGMATVHFGRMRGAVGFARIVAVKRLHPHLAKDDDFTSMFLDEARIASRIQHPNAANILDVVSLPEGELLIVMEYIAGESLSRLSRHLRGDGDLAPPDVVAAIVCDGLHGLHAAHEAKNDRGEPLGIVHRDVSPQNLLVGADGITRIVDFGVAKARGRIHATRDGQVKGKLAYMPPEQLRGQSIDRRCDVYAMGVVTWEMLTGERLFLRDSEGETVTNVLEQKVVAPSERVPTLPKSLDAIVLKALSRDPSQRYATARDMASAIEAATHVASARKVASFVDTVAGHVLTQRQRVVAELERRTEEEDSAIGTPSGVDVPSRPQGEVSQISSVSLTTDPPLKSRRRRRAVYASVAVLALVSIGFAAVKLRAHAQAAPPSPTPSSEALLPSVVAPPSIASTTSVAPTASALASAVAADTSIVTHVSPAPTARHVPSTHAPRAASSADRDKEKEKPPCPVKTFVDADGIVQFRRECAP